MAHTARLETFDILSQAARTGCSFLLHCPSAFSNDALHDVVNKTSEAKNDDEVRLMEGINECEDSMDKGELGESGERVSGDCGVGLSTPSPSHKDAGLGSRI